MLTALPPEVAAAPVTVSVAVVGVVAVLAVLGPVTLVRLPEPGPDHPGFDPAKRPYASLTGSPRTAVWAAVGGSAALTATLLLPVTLWPPWLALAIGGTLLAGIDAATTWLPWRLTWLTGAGVLLAGGLALVLGAAPGTLVRLLAGGGLAFAWYLLVYLLSRRRLGVGDVWLSALAGAPAATAGWSVLYLCVLLGALVGGVQGVVLRTRGHRGGFAYGPAVVAGAFLALPAARLLGVP